MATRAKKILISNVSHEEAEQAMAVFAKCNTQLKLIESRMEEESNWSTTNTWAILPN